MSLEIGSSDPLTCSLGACEQIRTSGQDSATSFARRDKAASSCGPLSSHSGRAIGYDAFKELPPA